MKIIETKTIPDEEWCDNYTSFKGTKMVEVKDSGDSDQLKLEYDFISRYGRTRRHIKVTRPGDGPLLTFVGKDRWSQDGGVVAKIKKTTGRGYIKDRRNIDPELDDFQARRLHRVIRPKPGRRVEACWCIPAQEDDLSTLVEIALAHERAHAEDE